MGRSNFDHAATECGPCWHCTAFLGMLYDNTAARCCRKGCSAVRSSPVNGCCGFEREVGADDEPGPPGGARIDPSWLQMVGERRPLSLYEPGRHPLTEGG